MELLGTLWLTSDDKQVVECTDQAKVWGAWKVGGGHSIQIVAADERLPLFSEWT